MELNQFMFPMAGPSVGFSAVGGNQTAGLAVGIQAPGSSFVNLLDLVSDLEIGESQETGLGADFMKSLSAEVIDGPKGELSQQAADAQISGMALSMAAPNLFAEAAKPTSPSVQEKAIGQIQFVKNEQHLVQGENGIDLIQQMTSQAAELGATSTKGFAAAKNFQADQLKSEAVAQWGAAIASGDLKSVTLEEGLTPSRIRDAQPLLSADLAPSALLKSDAALEKDSSKGSLDHKDKSSHLQNPLKSTLADDNRLPSSFEKVSLPKVSLDKGSAKNPESDNKAVSMDAKQVLLDQASVQSLHGAIATAGSAQTARLSSGSLRQASTLGEAGDSRIATNSLEFVANKIDQLKSQGGGSIRIELAPKELGSIDVKVGMRGGVLQVQIKAENMVTQQALESSKNDLMTRLGSVGSADVEVASLKSAASGVQFGQLKGASSSSEQFLSAHNVSDSSQGSKFGLDQNMQTQSSMGSALLNKSNELGQSSSSHFFSSDFMGSQMSQNKTSGQSSMTSSGDFLSQRDSQAGSRDQNESFRNERRDQAREQWEQFSRKSA